MHFECSNALVMPWRGYNNNLGNAGCSRLEVSGSETLDKLGGDPSLSMSAKKRSCLSVASSPLLASEGANGSTNLSCRRGSYPQSGRIKRNSREAQHQSTRALEH